MRSSQARARTQLNTLTTAKQAADYTTCIDTGTSIPRTSSIFSQAQSILGNCRLERARQLTQAGQYRAAIASAHQIPRGVPSYEPAQAEISRWSERILELAEEQFQQGELDNAIAMAEAIPNYSPTHEVAQLAIGTWQQQWQADEQNARQARQAFERGSWTEAIAATQRVTSPYWQEQVATIARQSNAQLASNRSSTSVSSSARATAPPAPPTRLANPTSLQSPPRPELSVERTVPDRDRQQEWERQQRQREQEIARQQREWEEEQREFEQERRRRNQRRRGRGRQRGERRNRNPATIEEQIASEIEAVIIRRVEDFLR